MNIGMMTFHKSESHGAMLQAFALQEVLEAFGNIVEIIDYDRFFLKSQNQVSASTLTGKIKKVMISVITSLYRKIYKNSENTKKNNYALFRSNYLKIGSKEYHTSIELKNDNLYYDAYVVGSDQVWNPDSIIHDAYYLTFVNENAKTIAYAPSIGVSSIRNQIIRYKMKEYLKHIRYLSCREKIGADVIEDITGRHVEHVLDPTLLLTKEKWEDLIPNSRKHEPYVLCYFLGSLMYGRKCAKVIAHKIGCSVLVIPQSPVELFSLNNKEMGAGPIEFLELFKNATFICTDSFHGTSFAINFQKPFYSFCRRNPSGSASRISRIKGILDELGLSDRLLMPSDKINTQNLELQVDYCKSIKLLEVARSKSMRYLIDALQSD